MTIRVARFLCPFAVAILGLGATPAPGRSAPALPGPLAPLPTEIVSILEEHGVPGIGIALVARDSLIWVSGLGLSNRETGEPVTGETLFRVGSISKSFIGLALLMLENEGRVELDAPVRDLAPEIAPQNPWSASDPVRLSHLLEHTSGIEDVHFREVYDLTGDPTLSLREVLAISPDTRHVRWRPGTHVAYSNHGYTMAAHAMENVTGERFEDHVGRVLLAPLEMTRTSFGLPRPITSEMAQGYTANDEPMPLVTMHHRPASSCVSSPHDLARFVQFMLNRGTAGGRAIVDEATIERMETSTTGWSARAGFLDGYGIGNRTRLWRGHRYRGHGGGLPGFSSVYGYFDDLGVGFVLLINSGKADALAAIQRRVLERLVPERMTIPETSGDTYAMIARSYVGRYEYCNPERALDALPNIVLGGVTVTWENDTLYTEEFLSERKALLPVTPHLFRRRADPFPTMVFQRQADGRVLLAEPMYRAEYVRVSAWRSIAHRWLPAGALLVLLSTLLHAMVWVPMRLARVFRGRGPDLRGGPWAIWSLLAVLSLVGVGVAIALWAQEPQQAGELSAASVGVFAGTLLFGMFSLVTVLTSIPAILSRGNRWVKAHGILIAAAAAGLTLYLAHWDLIGLRLWAY